MQLKNQFLMAPVKLGYSDGSGEIKDKHLKFYQNAAGISGPSRPNLCIWTRDCVKFPAKSVSTMTIKLPV